LRTVVVVVVAADVLVSLSELHPDATITNTASAALIGVVTRTGRD
jgi:hypothetical protein